MNTIRNRGIRALGLKKDSNGTYYNPNMYGLEFVKSKNGEIKMIIPEWFKKEHKQKLRTLHYYGKKYGISNNTDIKREKDLYKYYVDYVKNGTMAKYLKQVQSNTVLIYITKIKNQLTDFTEGRTNKRLSNTSTKVLKLKL